MVKKTLVEGSCNCRKVKFNVSQPLADVYVCHCSICRKSTGSGGIAVAVVPSSSLSWLEGQSSIQTWSKPDHDWLTNFCITCGSPLPGKNDDETTYIPVSLLDSGYENLQVKHHIWVGSKAIWEEIGDSGKEHQEAFGE